MNQTQSKEILNTIMDGVGYQVFKRAPIPDKCDDAAVTVQISTIQFFLRSANKPNVPTISDKFTARNGYYVQVVAPEGGLPPFSYLFWAKGGGMATGMAAILLVPEFPVVTTATYERFKKEVKGIVGKIV